MRLCYKNIKKKPTQWKAGKRKCFLHSSHLSAPFTPAASPLILFLLPYPAAVIQVVVLLFLKLHKKFPKRKCNLIKNVLLLAESLAVRCSFCLLPLFGAATSCPLLFFYESFLPIRHPGATTLGPRVVGKHDEFLAQISRRTFPFPTLFFAFPWLCPPSVLSRSCRGPQNRLRLTASDKQAAIRNAAKRIDGRGPLTLGASP